MNRYISKKIEFATFTWNSTELKVGQDDSNFGTVHYYIMFL